MNSWPFRLIDSQALVRSVPESDPFAMKFVTADPKEEAGNQKMIWIQSAILRNSVFSMAENWDERPWSASK
jgi:hypothetical protein